MVDQRSTILNYLSPVLIPRPRIRDHVNYTLRSSCLRFLATVIPYQRQNSRQNALKGEAERSLQREMEDVSVEDKTREREKDLISAHRPASPSARENRPSDDPPRRTRTRTWDAPRSRTSRRVPPPVVRGRANRSSCPRDSPNTALSPRTRAPRQARETGGTRLPVNHVAQDPLVGGNPLRPGISRRPVIDGREPARWSRRYRPVSRTQKKKEKEKKKGHLSNYLVTWRFSPPRSGRSIVQRFTGGDRPVEKGDV